MAFAPRHARICIQMWMCTYANRRTPSFQQASHLGNSYFRKEHSVGTNTASSFTLCLCSLCFPCSPSFSLLLCFSLFLTYTFHPLKLLFWLIFWLFSHPSIFSLSLFILAPAVMSPRRLAQQTSLQLVKTGWWAAHSCRTLNRFRECVLRWIELITERVREKGGQGGVSGNGWRQGSRDEWKGLTNKWRVWGKKP